MKQKIALEGLTLALAMLVCQLVLILAISTVWFYQTGAFAGRSSLFGGHVLGSSSPVHALGSAPQGDEGECGPGSAGTFMVGQGLSSLLQQDFFALMFGAGIEVDTVSFFATYILALVVQWIVSFTLNNHY